MGHTWRQIQSSCKTLKSDHVFSWNLVIAPYPALFSLIDKEDRHKHIENITDSIIAAYVVGKG